VRIGLMRVISEVEHQGCVIIGAMPDPPAKRTKPAA
jgi:hypothetical protein